MTEDEHIQTAVRGALDSFTESRSYPTRDGLWFEISRRLPKKYATIQLHCLIEQEHKRAIKVIENRIR